MKSVSDALGAFRGGRKVFFLLLFFALLAFASPEALAIDCVADAGGVIDGFVNYPVPPAQIQIDGNCTIRNYPANNPLNSNFSFYGPGRDYLIVFDNVVHIGNMSCNSVHDHKIWFTNGSWSTIRASCQNILIPVEKIEKDNPPGPPVAAIGVPFTYSLTIPVLFDPATGTVIDFQGSPNDLHGITIWDDLNATGADLSYVSHIAYWLSDSSPVPHTFSNVGGLLTFDNFPIVPAGEQFVIELTVVLNDTSANAPGTQFINTAKWDFGRLIDGVFYEPLPGEWGITPPLTIAAPDLVVTKTGPATMNLGQWGSFVIDVQNVGLGDAWDVSLGDLFPDGPTGGMCDLTPEILSAQVFAADGVTPVPGKGPLNPGTDFLFSYSAAPTCRLDLTMLTAEGVIGANERLIITYRTQLDANTQNGVALTNVAGSVQWFNGDSSNPNRIPFARTLTNGTVGTADHEDAHTVNVALSGYLFEKTVANLTTGVNPATIASPGETLRYSLRFQTTAQAMNNFSIRDELDSLNAPPAFEPGTLTLVTYPAGADVTGTSSTGGAAGTGLLDIGNLNLPANSQLLIEFDITLASSLSHGMVVANQSTLLDSGGTTFALSDDPNVNGAADPLVPGDEDPTRLTIDALPDFVVEKISTDLTADPNVLLAGETLRYTLTVRNIGTGDAVDATLRDAIPANTTYVAGSTTLNGAPVADVGGVSPLVAGMLINSPSDPTPGFMPADTSGNPATLATITFDVVVDPATANGTIISNQGFVSSVAAGIPDQPSDDPGTPAADDPTLNVVGNFPLLFADKSVTLSVDLGSPGLVDPGDVLRYTITVQNSGGVPATGVVLTDAVPANTTYVADSTLLNGLPVGQPDGGVSPLASGIDISSSDLTPPLPGAGAGVISPGETAVLQFDLMVDAGTPAGTVISNQATVASAELPDLPTDGDGDPATGPEPTVVVVDDSQLLAITKQVSVVGGGPALPGSVLEYVVRVENIAPVPAYNVVITDDLDVPVAGQLAYVPGSATMNGSATGVSFAGTTITADYATAYGVLQPGAVVLLRFQATLDPGLAPGTTVTNVGEVGWNNPTETASASVSIVVALSGFLFEKTVANQTTGVNPTLTASPGHTLRYSLRYVTTGQALNNFSIRDELDALNLPPAFVPGSLTLVTFPAGADVTGTSSTGGAAGTGLLDVGNLSLPANGQLLIEFDITLASTLSNGMVVTNQSTLLDTGGSTLTLSDDPNVNGPADPLVAGDEDPTRVTIDAQPAFLVEKISTDLTGSPTVLLAGETLRYTLTVGNIGTGDAVNVSLRDAIPANTTYVAGSTTLNGAPVADVGGVSPLVAGMLINAPSDPTPGALPADPSSNPINVATITFDVVVDPATANGTVISNQGFVTSVAAGISDQPSDDPTTPAVDDPTLDIVGNLPLLYADKSVTLSVDLGTPGFVDPGDVLRYTITVQNSAAIPATGVVLTDAVPTNTTYVADSTLLNGEPVGQPDGGVSPLASGIDISSSDLTPPLPGAGAGVISPGETAVLQFDLMVDAGTPAGTVISNQAIVASVELPDLPTDGDGDPATGPEPTEVVVADSQQLAITKQVSVVGGGPALPGSVLEYVVQVENIAAVPAFNIVITDDLDLPVAGQLAYVPGSATMNGSATGVSFAGSTITADYATAYGVLLPGGIVQLRFRATLDPGLTQGTIVTNIGEVAWNNPTETASASVSIAIGGVPGVGSLNGSAWHDADFDNVRDAAERRLAGWDVEVYQGGSLVLSTQTDPAGDFRIVGLVPNDTGGAPYELRFRAPGTGPNTAMLGQTDSPFTDGMQTITGIIVSSGDNHLGLNLPIDPNGVIYDSMSRAPVAGVTLTLLNAGSGAPLPVGCFGDAAQQGQVTLADGYYKFDLNFGNPSCLSGDDYIVDVSVPPGAFYAAGASQVIPPMSDGSTAAFGVPGCPGTGADTVLATAQHCEVQSSEFAPGAAVPPLGPGTTHHLHLTLDGSLMPGTSQIFNNHIPIDPVLFGSVAITKTTPLVNVNRGQMVPYTITLTNVSGTLLTDVGIVDTIPAGFSYVTGSALLDDVQSEPSITANVLTWSGLTLAGTQSSTLKMLLAVGAGVGEGEFVNRVQAVNQVSGGAISGEATATVRVTPDPTFDCTDVLGKVFDDSNRNGVQDDGEEGLQGVRVVTARGLRATTDEHGRYHITCAIVPHEGRGSNFVLKIDDRTLPSGFRLSTDKVLVKRATRGRVLKMNFGASIHRVVAIDLSDVVFEPGSDELRVQWQPRIDVLLEELKKAPSVLRLSYLADTEDESLVQRRVEAIKRQISDAWEAADCCYELTIEREIFWRLGAPPKQSRSSMKGSR